MYFVGLLPTISRVCLVNRLLVTDIAEQAFSHSCPLLYLLNPPWNSPLSCDWPAVPLLALPSREDKYYFSCSDATPGIHKFSFLSLDVIAGLAVRQKTLVKEL